MIFVVFIVANLLLMAALFAFGMYQFLQVEEKRKRSRLLTDAGVDVTELQALVGAEDRQEEAVSSADERGRCRPLHRRVRAGAFGWRIRRRRIVRETLATISM